MGCFLSKGWIVEWLVIPLTFVAFMHFLIWAAVSFVTLDVFYLSALGHRVLVLVLSIFAWATLLNAKIDESRDK